MPSRIPFVFFAAIVIIVSCDDSSSSENSRQRLFKNGPCSNEEFLCQNKRCVKKARVCDGSNHCGDNSDERYCNINYGDSCLDEHSFMKCKIRSGYWRCIPKVWMCDGTSDCYEGQDENCDDFSDAEAISAHITRARNAAKKWILSKRKAGNSALKWGVDMPRTAVTLYFSQNNLTNIKNYTDEVAYELIINLLSKLALKNIDDIETSELAAFVNSFLAFCINPRRFFVVDLVSELRKRVDAQDRANPFALLTLCNAQEIITEGDVEKLLNAFQKSNDEYRTDTQAIIIMALACASSQPDGNFNQEDLSDFTMEIKKKQYRNGTVENVKTTALVLQALFAAEAEPDENNFDEQKAIKQILRSQERDGSFGGIMNTYYVLPILSMSSLVNITAAKCPKETKDDNEGLEYLKNQPGEKWNVTYSIWIGENKFVQRSLTLSVPANTSFYGIMEYAADLDDMYKFQYNVRNRKPYIFALSGLMDDPEMERFWYPYYRLSNTTVPVLISKSPADVIPKNNEHILFWYRKEA